MLYDTRCWVVKNQHKNKLSVAKIKMLYWMYNKTKQNKIKSVNIRAPIVEKICGRLM